MVLTGLIIVIVTFALIVKKFETRVVLMASGFLMTLIGGVPGNSINAFIGEYCNKALVPTICITMGFAATLEYTGCAKHLVVLSTRVLSRFKLVILPLTVIFVWLMNIALLSAAGTAAAVGALMIPLLMRLGFSPVVAASAIMLGTWGGGISPANPFCVMAAQIADVEMMGMIFRFVPTMVIGMLATVAVFTVVAKFRKNDAADIQSVEENDEIDNFRVNYLKAIVPLIPLVILVLACPVVAVLPKISVPVAMLIGTLLCFIVARTEVKGFMMSFFNANGKAFSDVICLIAAAAMFISGMNAMGLTAAMIDVMKGSSSIATVAATYGTFTLAAVSGSGNAATLAFNGTVVPFAPQFGLSTETMAMMCQAMSNFGRCMSPVAGATIICARMAGVNPFEIAKMNAIPCILGAFVMMILAFYL